MTGIGFVGGDLGYRILRRIGAGAARADEHGAADVYEGRSKLEVLFGPTFMADIAGKVVVDFGCAFGFEAIDLARHGARQVIGIDIRPWVLDEARAAAQRAGVADRCTFTERTHETADVIVSLDGFEHFADPSDVLEQMRAMLRPDGRVFACFGPTWLHPHGGHLFSVFPWAHLVFTEKALLRWRSDFKTDGATRFGEVDGGLNQMTIRRFEQVLEASPFRVESMTAVPIRRARWLHNRLTRELFTSVVRCQLAPRP